MNANSAFLYCCLWFHKSYDLFKVKSRAGVQHKRKIKLQVLSLRRRILNTDKSITITYFYLMLIYSSLTTSKTEILLLLLEAWNEFTQKTLTGQFSHTQLCILTGSLSSRAAFCCCSLQSIALQNINHICLPAHSCKGQADHKISVLRKNGSRDFYIQEME